MKANIKEIEKIVKEMTVDHKQAPNYNAAAAKIVSDGVQDKIDSKYGYTPKLSGPQKL